MLDDNLMDLTAAELSRRIATGETDCESVVAACVSRIQHRNVTLHAFVTIFADEALARARLLDNELAQGKRRGPLHGIPVAIKDLIDIEGAPTGFGSRCYADGPARRSARVVTMLEQAGAVIVGKTHTVEFAFGSWGTNHALGTPVNPAFPGHHAPGGSSSGSAVAVAARLVPLALGTDTGGSVRIPAALCGVAGLKTSHGTVPLDGVAPLSAALDTVGPIARDADDLRLLFNAISEVSSAQTADRAMGRLWRISPEDLEPVAPDVLAAYEATVAEMGQGVSQMVLPLPLAEYQKRCGALMAFDAYRNLARLVDDHRLPMDPHVRRRIAAGADISRTDHDRALTRRVEDMMAFASRFGDHDVLILPTTPITASPVAEIDETMIPMSRFTRIANYLDLCSVTLPVPSGTEAPIGMQYIARRGRDADLLAWASR